MSLFGKRKKKEKAPPRTEGAMDVFCPTWKGGRKFPRRA